SYAVQRIVRKRTRRVTIAEVGSIPFADARARAGKIIADMHAGIDPKHRGGELTLEAALDRYLKLRTNLSPRSVEGYREAMTYLGSGKWLKLPLAEITREMVEDEHLAIAKRIAREGRYSGRATANSAMRALRAVWNHAADRDAELLAVGCPV